MRKRIYKFISSVPYSAGMITVIIISIIPLAFHNEYSFFSIIEFSSTIVFIFDYVARWITADMNNQKSKFAFIIYPLQPLTIIDLLSILPSVTALSSSFRLLKLFRLFRTLRVFRAFKLARYSRNIQIIANVFKAQRDSLLAVLALAGAYIIISALVVLNVEPDTFKDFFEAIYWATVSLTTMGYGDIYPITAIGRTVTIFSSLFGIAIVALPAGIVTAGYMEEIQKANNHFDNNENDITDICLPDEKQSGTNYGKENSHGK